MMPNKTKISNFAMGFVFVAFVKAYKETFILSIHRLVRIAYENGLLLHQGLLILLLSVYSLLPIFIIISPFFIYDYPYNLFSSLFCVVIFIVLTRALFNFMRLTWAVLAFLYTFFLFSPILEIFDINIYLIILLFLLGYLFSSSLIFLINAIVIIVHFIFLSHLIFLTHFFVPHFSTDSSKLFARYYQFIKSTFKLLKKENLISNRIVIIIPIVLLAFLLFNVTNNYYIIIFFCYLVIIVLLVLFSLSNMEEVKNFFKNVLLVLLLIIFIIFTNFIFNNYINFLFENLSSIIFSFSVAILLNFFVFSWIFLTFLIIYIPYPEDIEPIPFLRKTMLILLIISSLFIIPSFNEQFFIFLSKPFSLSTTLWLKVLFVIFNLLLIVRALKLPNKEEVSKIRQFIQSHQIHQSEKDEILITLEKIEKEERKSAFPSHELLDEIAKIRQIFRQEQRQAELMDDVPPIAQNYFQCRAFDFTDPILENNHPTALSPIDSARQQLLNWLKGETLEKPSIDKLLIYQWQDYEIGIGLKYSGQMGGDFYDLFQLTPNANNQIGLLIGDLTGHGVETALNISKTHNFWTETDLSQDVLTTMRAFEQNFKTTFHPFPNREGCELCYLQLKDNEITLSRAGLHLGLIRDNQWHDIAPPPDENLGSLGKWQSLPVKRYTRVELKAGETLIVYTDGLFENDDQNDEQFGQDNLKQLLLQQQSLDMNTLINTVFSTVYEYCQPKPIEDDETLLVIRRKVNQI